MYTWNEATLSGVSRFDKTGWFRSCYQLFADGEARYRVLVDGVELARGLTVDEARRLCEQHAAARTQP